MNDVFATPSSAPFRIDARDVHPEHVACPVCGRDEPRAYRADMYSISGVRFPLVRCPCGLVYVSPRPDGRTLGRMYDDPDYYTEGYNLGVETENYFTRRTELVAQYEATARELARAVGKAGDLLELGSAGGFFLEGARRAGFRVRGIELSPSATEYARRELGLEIHHGDLMEAPWPTASFDVAYADNVLEHTTDPVAVVRKLGLLLRAGGLLVVIVPSYVNSPWFRALLAAQRGVPRRFLGRELVRILKMDAESDSGHPYHILEFDRTTLCDVIRRAGLEIESVEGSVPLPAHLFKARHADLRTHCLRAVFSTLDFGMRHRLLPPARITLRARKP